MSHQPPIPEAARSPYPLQPPPIAHREDDERAADDSANEDDAEQRSWGDRARDNKVGIGAAVGIGSAALVAALLFTRRGNGGRGSAS